MVWQFLTNFNEFIFLIDYMGNLNSSYQTKIEQLKEEFSKRSKTVESLVENIHNDLVQIAKCFSSFHNVFHRDSFIFIGIINQIECVSFLKMILKKWIKFEYMYLWIHDEYRNLFPFEKNLKVKKIAFNPWMKRRCPRIFDFFLTNYNQDFFFKILYIRIRHLLKVDLKFSPWILIWSHFPLNLTRNILWNHHLI